MLCLFQNKTGLSTLAPAEMAKAGNTWPFVLCLTWIRKVTNLAGSRR